MRKTLMGKMTKQTFAACYYCGGLVEQKVISYMRKWQGEYLLIENVPAGVCNQCGEKYFKAKVAEKMDELMLKKEKNGREISIPVLELQRDAA